MGIDTIDTAISYGNSLNRLGELGIRNFKIITKFPKIPDDRKNKLIGSMNKSKDLKTTRC
ncbi:MAG: hypothetical protein CM15mP106_0470 [Candidatus Neomarinimicrobiota bacterium]|nr:MAG: hypothetical protein CM15mP106_0470 [Candidatus Neomarinimicrobiota bacterium]